MSTSTIGDIEESDDQDGQLVHGRRRDKVSFVPSLGSFTFFLVPPPLIVYNSTDTTHTIFYRGHWLRVSFYIVVRFSADAD